MVYNATVPEQIVFRWMQTEEPLSLYCPDETDLDSLRACMQIYETLYSFENNQAKVVPKLAEKCEGNESFTEWRCQLRQGITFHDKTTLDANDVVVSFLIQWDQEHPLHLGKAGRFEYFETFWGGFLNAK